LIRLPRNTTRERIKRNFWKRRFPKYGQIAYDLKRGKLEGRPMKGEGESCDGKTG